MTVTVIWFGQLRDAAGTSHEQAEIPEGTSLSGMLKIIVQDDRSALKGLVFGPDGGVSRTLVISVEDRQIHEPPTTLLQDGATVTMMSPISGG